MKNTDINEDGVLYPSNWTFTLTSSYFRSLALYSELLYRRTRLSQASIIPFIRIFNAFHPLVWLNDERLDG